MKYHLLIFFVLLISIKSYSQNESAKTVLEKVQSKFNSMIDMKSDFYQSIKYTSAGSEYSLKGKFYYKKKSKFRIEINNKILLNDGKSIYNIDKSAKRVVISPINDASAGFSIDRIVNEYPKKCSVRLITENKKEFIELIPKSNDLPFNKVRLFVSDQNMVEKFVIIDLSNDQTTIQLNNLIVNSNIPNSSFIFTEQSGYEIIDLR